jgi:peptidoglycan/LPS O-acetylase OafA/YrhL
LMVLLVHTNSGSFGGRPPGRESLHLLPAIFGAGWVGVDLFFVLSGFLITRILLGAKHHPGYFFNFYRNRVLRIFPLYYGTLFLVLIVVAHLDWVQPIIRAGIFWINKGDRASLLGFYYNFRESMLTHRSVPQLTQFWSLCVEEHFYLLWPLVVWKFSARQLKWICLAVIAVSTSCRALIVFEHWQYRIAYLATPCRLDGLAIGGLIALMFARDSLQRSLWWWATSLLLASGAALAAIVSQTHHFYEFVDPRLGDWQLPDSALVMVPGILALNIFFGSILMLILWSSLRRSLLSKLMTCSPLRSIGKYSFGIYCFHPLLMAISATYIEQRHKTGLATMNPLYGKPLMACWTLLISYIAAFISFQFWEKPFQSLRHRSPAGQAPSSRISDPSMDRNQPATASSAISLLQSPDQS